MGTKSQGASAILEIALSSTGFQGTRAQPPSKAEIQSCNAAVEVDVDVDLGGTISNFFGNGLLWFIESTFNSIGETVLCTVAAGYEIDWSKLTLGLSKAS